MKWRRVTFIGVLPLPITGSAAVIVGQRLSGGTDSISLVKGRGEA
jgi:hypothetical protein